MTDFHRFLRELDLTGRTYTVNDVQKKYHSAIQMAQNKMEKQTSRDFFAEWDELWFANGDTASGNVKGAIYGMFDYYDFGTPLETQLDQVLHFINMAAIVAAELLVIEEDKQRALWDPTHPDHVHPVLGGDDARTATA